MKRTLVRGIPSVLAALALSGFVVAQQPAGPSSQSSQGRGNPNSPRDLALAGTLEIIDFEGLPGGTILSSVFTNKGSGPIGVDSRSPILGDTNVAVIFDSANPTGNDPDLGTPNEDFGGPGTGEAGEAGSPFANTQEQGNILIIPLNLIDANNDGLVDDPNDVDLVGSTHEFDFSVIGPVAVAGITLIDIESERLPSVVEFFDSNNNPVGPSPLVLTQTGDNGVANINFGIVDNVSRMVVTMNGSGAIDNIVLQTCDPCISVATQCLDAATPEGDIQVFGTVTNCGNTDLSDVMVVDDQLGPVLGPLTLAPGEEAMYSGSYTPTSSPSTNTATATGSPPEGCNTDDVMAEASATCTTPPCNPCIEVSVECQDAPLGQEIPVMGTVRNCGDVTLTDVSVFDSGLGVVISLITLAPGEEATYAGSYVPLSNPTTNTSTAVGTPPSICDLPNVTSMAESTCAIICNPCIEIETICADAPGPKGEISVFGTVRNCGDVGILNIDVFDDKIGNVVSGGALGPGGELTYMGSYSRSTNPSTNTAVVTGDPVAICNSDPVTDTDSASCGVPCAPCIDVETECTTPRFPGDPVLVSGTVSNCGDATLSNVSVVDDQLGLVVSGITLAPGEQQTYGGSYAPMSNPTSNTSMASGTPPAICNVREVNDSDTATCDLCTGTIGDFVWNDLDMDGIQDPGEPGKEGVEVCLLDDMGNQIACTITDENGFYTFGGLCAGDYVVVTTPVPGFVSSPCMVGNDPTIDNNCSPADVNLPTDNSNDDTIDFGCFEPCTARIGDFVWHDTNENNVQDPGEPGIPGVVVLLCDADNNELASVTTDEQGFYIFEELCAGEYKVKVDESTVPPEFGPVLCDFGMDDTIDSDCQPVCVELCCDDEECLDKDFGYSFCDECSGRVSELTLRWLGDTARNIRVEQKDGGIVFDGLVESNGAFSFVGTDDGSFGTRINMFVNGTPDIEIHTSCSKPIGPGFIFGEFEVLAGRSVDGGLMCNADCAECDGKVTRLCMTYDGADARAIDVYQDNTDSIIFSGLVNPGEVFCFSGNDDDGTMGTRINMFVNGVEDVEIHTSCSQPIGPGSVFGDFTVVEAWSREGGPICPEPPPGEGICDSGFDDKVQRITVRYTGEDCSATSTTQPDDKYDCVDLNGGPNMAATVRIVATGKNAGDVLFDGLVNLGETYTIDATVIGNTKLDSTTNVDIFDLNDNPLQDVFFHTSCSQPLFVGDQFGANAIEELFFE